MITVVLVDLAAAGPALDCIEQETPRLSEHENDRAAAIPAADRRTAWRAAHVALRLVLERTAGPGVRGQPYATGAHGRPALPCGGPVFSLSHTAGLAAIAVATDGPLGVDVEARRAVAMTDARRALLLAAAAALGPAPADLIDAWTRLEAVGKARGTGVGAVLEALRRRPDKSDTVADPGAASGADGDWAGAAAAMQALATAAGLAVHDLAVPAGYAGALAAGQGAAGPVPIWLPAAPDALRAFAAVSNAVDLAEPAGHKGA